MPEKIDKRSYIVLKGGGWTLQDDDIEDSDLGLYGEIAFGSKFNRFLGIELGVGYMGTEGKFLLSDAKVYIIPVNMSLRLGIPIAIVEPFIIAGGGLYFNTVDISSTSKTTTTGGYHGGLGNDFNLSFLLLGAEWRYCATEGKILGQTITIDGSYLCCESGLPLLMRHSPFKFF